MTEQANPPAGPDTRRTLEAAVDDPNVAKIYANAFSLGLSNADMQIVLQRLNRPVAIVSLSYTLAKTLHVRLGQLVAEFEATTGRKMLVTDEVDLAFGRQQNGREPKA